MKKWLLLAYFFFLVFNLYSQTSLEVLELQLLNIRTKFDDNIFIENQSDGPSVILMCSIYNKSNDKLILFPSESEIEISFNYQGVVYYKDNISFVLMEKNTLMINPNERFDFYLSEPILLGTPIWDDKEEDYTMILLELTPTIQVKYSDKNTMIKSGHIQKVVIAK